MSVWLQCFSQRLLSPEPVPQQHCCCAMLALCQRSVRALLPLGERCLWLPDLDLRRFCTCLLQQHHCFAQSLCLQQPGVLHPGTLSLRLALAVHLRALSCPWKL